ncbi:MAG: hypothetical protein Q7R95_10905 [bacterium]|nr:hypothetical protein [bacterium]
MKKLLIFFIFLFIGIVLGSIYYVWKNNQTNSDIEQVKKEPRFSIETAPKNSEVGTIQSMSGTIKWGSRIAIATEGAQITKPVPIQQGEELMSGEDGSAIIHYQSGLTISLSPNSHISFIQMLSTNFVLNQLKGTIEYEKNSPIPLGIRSLHLLMQMDNGDIQIVTDEKIGLIEITVKRGSVRIAFNDLQNISNVVSLSQGDQYLFDDKKRQGNIVTSR